MAWDEWERLKAAVAERETARMRLDQLPTDPNGGTGTLISNRPAWTRAGTDIGSLREEVDKAAARLGNSRTGPSAGCLTAAAHQDVHSSWETYVKDVGDRCGRLSGLLAKAGHDLLRTDESVEAEVAALDVAYADTPALGGQGHGRDR